MYKERIHWIKHAREIGKALFPDWFFTDQLGGKLSQASRYTR
jgi:hypothetical protein